MSSKNDPSSCSSEFICNKISSDIVFDIDFEGNYNSEGSLIFFAHTDDLTGFFI